MPVTEPTKANIWHHIVPLAKPRFIELYIIIGVLAIMKKSKIAKVTTNMLEGVLRGFDLEKIN